MVRFNEFQMYPNLKFSAPEISATTARCSTGSDLYSLGCIIYFLMSLARNRDPYLLGQYNPTDPSQHASEVMMLRNSLHSKLQGMDIEVVQILQDIF